MIVYPDTEVPVTVKVFEVRVAPGAGDVITGAGTVYAYAVEPKRPAQTAIAKSAKSALISYTYH